MNEIIVKIENRDRIQAVLDAEQSRARSRRLDYADLVSECERIQRRLGITKAALEGTAADIDPHGVEPCKSYYRTAFRRPESTQARVRYHSGSWRLVRASRGAISGSSAARVELSETAKAAVLAAASRV